MHLQRSLILVFAAALTAGTSSATSLVTLQLSGAGGTSQFGSLSIDGTLLGSLSGNGSTPFYFGANLPETDGWHNIAIDYKDISGLNGLTLFVNGSYAPTLGSFNADGSTTSGLRGDFFTLAGAPLLTIYGGSQGPYLKYSGGTTPWSGTYGAFTFTSTSTFEEQLSGYIYFGNGTPLLSDIPAQQQSGGAAPEPAGWWLMAAALPLMLFSKLRLRRAKARQ